MPLQFPRLRRTLVCALLASSAAGFATPPIITQQPATVVATSGTSATFSVAATATGTLSYQWRRLGTPVTNGTGASLTLNAVTMADAGFYDVVVTADGESTTSQAGRLITTPTQYADQFCLDDSFLPLIETTGASAAVTAADTLTGGFYVGGEFSTIDGARRWNLARFDADGTIDSGFAPQVDGKVLTIAVQPDGKVLIGGAFRFVNNVQRGGIARLNTDGSLDRTFGNNRGFESEVTCLGLQSTGKIVVYSNSSFDGRSEGVRLVRLTPTGELDPEFKAFADPFYGHFATDANDRLLFQPNWWVGPLVRASPDGSHDTTFTPPHNLGTIYAFCAQTRGVVLVVVTGGASVVRLNEDGSKDEAYNRSLVHVSEYDPARIAIDALDRALIYDPWNRTLIRLLPGGAIDPDFVAPRYPVTDQNENAITILPASSRIVVVGEHEGGVRLYNTDGALRRAADLAFFKPATKVTHMLPLPSGGWLVGGDFSRVGGLPRNSLARLLPSGTVDPSFNPPSSGGPAAAIAQQGDGRIVLAHKASGIALDRLLADGSPDPSFDADDGRRFNSPSALTLQPNGKILAGGDGWLNRFEANGAADPSFIAPADPFPTTGGARIVSSIVVLNDSRILAVKGSPGSYSYPSPSFRRLLPDGTIDPTFGEGSDFNGGVRTISPLPDGDLLAGGEFSYWGMYSAVCTARLDANGKLKQAPSPAEIGYGVANSVTWMPDNRVVLSGQFSTGYWGVYDSIVRLRSNHTRDTSFHVPNLGSSPVATTQFDDLGRLLCAGASAGRCGLVQTGLVRLKPGTAPEPCITRDPIGAHFLPGTNTVLQVQASGTDLHYRWYKDGRYLVDSDTPTLSISTAKLTDSGRYHAEVFNTYGAVLSTGADLIITSEAQIEYYEWAAANGLADDWRKFPDEDPESDGVLNLFHYAFNIPRGAGRGDSINPTVVTENGVPYAAIEFTRKTFALDLSYHVEASSDLVNWQEIAIVPPAVPARITVKDILPSSDTDRRFMRVRVKYSGP